MFDAYPVLLRVTATFPQATFETRIIKGNVEVRFAKRGT